MTRDRTPSQKIKPGKRQLGIPVIFLLLATSGCVVSSDTPSGGDSRTTEESSGTSQSESANSENEVISSSTTTATDIGADLQIDIYALERLENNLIRLRLGITNHSSDSFDIGFGLSESQDRLSASDISLIDSTNQQRYVSYDQSDGSCFCESLDGPIEGSSTETLWVIYPEAPENVESMTVATPLTPPILDVPISTSPESIESDNLADPVIEDLTMISDSLEDQTGRTESAEEVSILLSSDVLFDTNSSDLNSDAEEILEQVAQEIDDASSSVVAIDGHADNTGSDGINVPLSEDRAESVEEALAGLVTREGITFESEGHGSADPIADNSTEEGRERNRRVSVTFEK